ncbi:MAG: HAMP domain-containing histidine kinase [Chloroflexi bacterium]|nr:HAMP domain-containing histidine kinase [Chloroflexota bacterium]
MLRSFRSRLLIAFLGVVLISLAVFLGLVWGQIRNYSREAKVEELRLRLKLLSLWVEPMSPKVKDALHSTSAYKGVALWLVYGDDQPDFYVSDGYAIPEADVPRVQSALKKELLQPRAAAFERGDLFLVTQPVTTADKTPALLVAVTPTASLESGWMHLVNAMRDAALFGLALSLVLAILIAASLARPVTRLTIAARRMADGIYDDPPLPAGTDELGRLTRAFDAMRQQVRQSRQRERDFLAGISHDLKTPLAILQGYANALSDGAASDDASRLRALSGIQREAERMTRLVTTLLELGRLQSGLVPFKPVAVDLAALARRVLADLSPQTQEKGLHFVDELPAGMPAIQADPTQIERVLLNLLDNAVRFTPQGGAITVGGSGGQGNRVSVWVQDSGPGIPTEALPHVFERFYQADPARSTGRRGSGLGLTIAREIVIRHGGKIEAENLPGQGARFTVSLQVLSARETLKVFSADSGDCLQDCLASHDDGSRGNL